MRQPWSPLLLLSPAILHCKAPNEVTLCSESSGGVDGLSCKVRPSRRLRKKKTNGRGHWRRSLKWNRSGKEEETSWRIAHWTKFCFVSELLGENRTHLLKATLQIYWEVSICGFLTYLASLSIAEGPWLESWQEVPLLLACFHHLWSSINYF